MSGPWREIRLFYVLDGHEPVALEGDDFDIVERWGAWRLQNNVRVAFTDLGYATVSTVFLGFDHGWGDGPPILFETMVFANPKPKETFPEELDGLMDRYATWDEAEAGHADMVAQVRQKFWKRAGNDK